MYAKCIVLFTLVFNLVNAVSVSEPLHPLSDEFIDLINKEGKWTAGRNFPEDTPMEYIKQLCGTHVDLVELKKIPVVKHDLETIDNLPESFDPRHKWPNCPTMNDIRDQARCGACWAFGAVEAMSDRICVYSNGTKNFRFSAEDVIQCNSFNIGCTGGGLASTWMYWVSEGVVSGGNYHSHDGCKPYSFPPCKDHLKKCTKYLPTPSCVRSCEKGYNTTYEKDKKRGKRFYVVYDEVDIMAELYKNGPVLVSFEVYQDFANYKSGVYQHLKGEYIGAHAIKMMGWGVENGTKYWLLANSWGPDFGENGFFKAIRGENNVMDMFAVAGEPLMEDY